MRVFPVAAFTTAVLAQALTTSSLSAQASPSLTDKLEADLADFPASMGVHVKHTETGEEAAVQADRSFNSMSVIKIPLIMLAYDIAERGEIDLHTFDPEAMPDPVFEPLYGHPDFERMRAGVVNERLRMQRTGLNLPPTTDRPNERGSEALWSSWFLMQPRRDVRGASSTQSTRPEV